jgi:imidazolonepropionase-like amidohydrolase
MKSLSLIIGAGIFAFACHLALGADPGPPSQETIVVEPVTVIDGGGSVLADRSIVVALEEAIRSATLAAAQMLGRERDLGSSEPDKLVDLVILDADPLADIRNLRQVHRIVRGGVVYAPADLPSSGRETRYSVLSAGRPCGTQTVQKVAEREWRIVFEFNDRGRGPHLTKRAVFDAAGIPTLIETTGHDYLKNVVQERFSLDHQKAAWKSSAEQGTRTLSAPAFYMSFDGAPVEFGWLAQALLAAPNHTLALLPDGEARIDRVETITLPSKGGPRSLTHYEIAGLDFSPTPVWLDDDGEFFAQGSDWAMIIRTGWEDSAPALTTAQARRNADRQRALARTLARKTRGPLVLVHARLFDPEKLRTVPGTTVVVSGNRIAQIGPDGTVPIPQGAEVVDVAGKTVLPGLWDMHVHLSFETDGLLNIAAGVTTVRDLANDMDRLLEMRRRYDEGTAIGPRVILAGFLDGPGLYAGPTKVLVDSTEDATQAIDRYKTKGYEQIKVYSSIKPELVRTIIERAHGRGMRVSGHVPALMTAEQVVRLGFDELQHMNYVFLNFMADTVKETRGPARFTSIPEHAAEVDPRSDRVQRFVALLKERHTVVDPTLNVFEAFYTDRFGRIAQGMAAVADRLPPTVRRRYLTGGLPVPKGMDERYRKAFEAMLEMLGVLHRAGITLVAGTDATAGFSLHRELELYVRAGLPAPEVLRMATLGAAAVMNREQELGSIAPGKLADLIVVAGDPGARISDIRRVELVVKDGTLFRPADVHRALGIRAMSP